MMEKENYNGELSYINGRKNSSYDVKLQSVLSCIILPDFKVTDDTVFQKLFDLICRTYNLEGISSDNNPFHELFIPWLNSVNEVWNDIHKSSQLLALKITGLMCQNEKHFLSLYKSDFFLKMVLNGRSSIKDDNSALVLGYIQLLQYTIFHKAGVNWVLDRDLWKEVLEISCTNKNLYVLRSSRFFIAQFVVSLSTYNWSSCHIVFDEALIYLPKGTKCIKYGDINSPLLVNSNKSCSEVNVLNEILLMREILNHMMQNKLPTGMMKDVLEKYNLHDWCWTHIHEGQDMKMLSNVSKLLCTLLICTINREQSGCVTYSAVRSFFQNFINHVTLLILKNSFEVIRESCMEYFELWDKLEARIIFEGNETEDNIYLIENSFFLFLAMPLFIFIRVSRMNSCDIMEAFVSRLFAVACPQSVRVGYLYREGYTKCEQNDHEAMAMATIHSLTSLASNLKKEQGVLTFQTLVYLLKKFTEHDAFEGNSDSSCLIVTCPRFLSAILDALQRYIVGFGISWRDSIETVCVLPVLQKILDSSDLTYKLCTEVLKAIKVTLIHSLPPSLALLVDTLQGSSLSDLGKQITKLLHSMHWEVRDSALEVLQVVSSMAGNKLPALQELLVERNLHSIVISMCFGDCEPYVRASAVKALREMIKIHSLWKAEIIQDTLNELLKLLYSESEGIVRYEALLLLKEIYCLQCMREKDKDIIYNVLCYITVKDLHWEVRRACFQFWNCILETFLTEEGMVDGCFPDHLFSREKRKIIKLTSSEKSNSVLRVLKLLSNTGGLQVLWKTIQDDCDLEVLKDACELSEKIMLLVHKFDITEDIEKDKANGQESWKKSSEGILGSDSLFNKVENPDTNVEVNDLHDEKAVPWENEIAVSTLDSVIDGIVHEKDRALLEALVLKPEPDAKVTPKYSKREILLVNDYLMKMKSEDPRVRLQQRQQWIRVTSDDLISLLDDILTSNKNSNDLESNSADCY